MRKSQIRHTLVGGLDKDTALQKLSHQVLRDAENIDVVGEGEFGVLRNIAGTSLVTEVLSDMGDVNVLGAFRVIGQYDYDCTGSFYVEGTAGVCKQCEAKAEHESILAFIWSEANGSEIFLYDLEAEQLHLLSDADGLNFPSLGTVEAVFYRDSGVPRIYFDDFCNELRRLDVRWSCAETWAVASVKAMGIRPTAPIDNLLYLETREGGLLDAGTYRIAYRYFDSKACRYSRWSLFTNPIAVVPDDCEEFEEGDLLVGGAVGEQTTKKICLRIEASSGEHLFYDSIQLAIQRYTTGEQVGETTVYLTPASEEWYGNLVDFCYTGNEGLVTEELANVVTEDANIAAAKTLALKDNRLFRANLKYHVLDFDNGVPKFKVARTIRRTVATTEMAYKCEEDTPRYKGYFRGEVYRFGIVYMDKYGNWSEVCPLDFRNNGRYKTDPARAVLTIAAGTAGIATGGYVSLLFQGDVVSSFQTGDVVLIDGIAYDVQYAELTGAGNTRLWIASDNGIAPIANGASLSFALGQAGSWSDGIDWKFAERCANQFTILNDNDSVQALGLRIEGIANHPSWAVAMAIVRLERKKDILFQSPHIPTVAVTGINTPGTKYTKAPLNLDDLTQIDVTTLFFEEDHDKELDTFEVKRHGYGQARNIYKEFLNYVLEIPTDFPSFGNTENFVIDIETSRYFTQGGITAFDLAHFQNAGIFPPQLNPAFFADAFETPPMIFATPLDYVYNNLGTPYLNYLAEKSHKVRIVDAVQFQRRNLSETVLVNDVSGNEDPIPFKNSANDFEALRSGQYFYTRKGIHIVGNDDVYLAKIEDVVIGFANEAQVDTSISYNRDVVLNSSFFDLPYAPMVLNDFYGHILRYGGSTELGISQGQHPSVSFDEFAGDNKFGEDLELQRGILLVLDKALQDLTRNAATNFLQGTANYFPFSGLAWTDKAYEYFLDDFISGDTNTETAVLTGFSDLDDTENNASCAAYVLNVVRGLGDDRYGSLEAGGEFVSTGVYVPLTPTDIENNVPITVDVFGGDCFVTKATIKVNNTNSFPLRYNPNDTALDDNTDFDASFLNLHKAWRVTPQEDNVEFLSLYLESEVNGAFGSEQNVYPHTEGDAISLYNQPYIYPYHFGYSAGNFGKVWQGKTNECKMDRGCYPSRVAWSDLKVKGTDTEGFDEFRELNVADLEEEYGSITKLVKTDNNYLFAIQEGAILPLPIGREQLELFDGSTLAVGTAGVMGQITQYSSTNVGSQHIRTIANIGSAVYGVDVRNRKIWRFGSTGQVQTISSVGMDSFFKGVLRGKFAERELSAWYDFDRLEYFLALRDFDTRGRYEAVVWNERMERWKTFLVCGTRPILRGVYGYQDAFVFTVREGSLEFWKLYDNDAPNGFVLGEFEPTRFELVVHSENMLTAVFDTIAISSIERIDTVRCLILDEGAAQPHQQTQVLSVNHKPQRHRYFLNKLRDEVTRSRLRGEFMTVRFEIINGTDNANRTVRVSFIDFGLRGEMVR